MCRFYRHIHTGNELDRSVHARTSLIRFIQFFPADVARGAKELPERFYCIPKRIFFSTSHKYCGEIKKMCTHMPPHILFFSGDTFCKEPQLNARM